MILKAFLQNIFQHLSYLKNLLLPLIVKLSSKLNIVSSTLKINSNQIFIISYLLPPFALLLNGFIFVLKITQYQTQTISLPRDLQIQPIPTIQNQILHNKLQPRYLEVFKHQMLTSTTSVPLTSILQTPQAFPLQQILNQKPSYMNKLIDYISVVPDPFVMNERQCYSYPSKSVQILNSIGVYKQIIRKEERKITMIDATKDQRNNAKEESDSTNYSYPYLQRLFKNLKVIQYEQILLGYVDRVLFSVTKKTPEIYEFFKDNEQFLMTILKNDNILFAMKQFLILFITQSTMMLYVFLKNMVLRTLMFRIVEEQSTGPVVYEMLCDFYSELLKSYICQTEQDEKEEIIQVLKNIEEQNFIALLALKISSEHHRRTYFIAKILNQIASSPNQVSSLVSPYIDTYTEYLQSYEESQDFMLVIMPDQLIMLKLILKICSLQKEALNDIKQELIKRLLVYCNVHQKNSILHTMLYTMLEILNQQRNTKILIRAQIIEFLKNNLNESTSLNFKSLVKRICIFYQEKQLDGMIQNQEEKEFVRKHANNRRQVLKSCQYFKDTDKKQATNQSAVLETPQMLVVEKQQNNQKPQPQSQVQQNVKNLV